MADKTISLGVSKESVFEYIVNSKIDSAKLAADLFYLLKTLEDVAELSHSDPRLAYQVIEQSGASNFPFLRAALVEQIFRHQVGLETKARSCVTEKQVERFFFDNLQKFVPGASVNKRPPAHNHLVPDGFLNIDGEICPVEVKKGNFSSRALHQLLAYIHEYGAKRGIAVAGGNAICSLPENIIFVHIDLDDVSNDSPPPRP